MFVFHSLIRNGFNASTPHCRQRINMTEDCVLISNLCPKKKQAIFQSIWFIVSSPMALNKPQTALSITDSVLDALAYTPHHVPEPSLPDDGGRKRCGPV